MRKIAASIVGAALAVALCIALVDAQPSPGFSKTAPLAGTGSSGAPLKITPCANGQILQSNGTAWSCIATPSSTGDIDAVTAGIGLEGGGTSGTVSLSLLTSCSDDQVLKSASSGTSWVCADDIDTDSGGDITSVGATANMGLTGGATSGAALLGLLSTCGDDQVLKSSSSGTAWVCADDEIGSPGAGDIESVTAGDGLTGGGTVGALTIDVGCGTGLSCGANAVTLNMTPQNCSAGSFLDEVTATGTFTCVAEVGDISGVTAGDGLSGGGTSGAVTVQMRQDCSNGQVVKWNTTDWVCDDDDTSSGFDTAGDGLTATGSTVNVICGSNLACAADSVNLATNPAVAGNLSVAGTTTMTGIAAIGTTTDANHPLTLAASVGNKIALYPVSSTQAFGFGVQSGVLQIYASQSTQRTGIGYGDSDAFTETLSVRGANAGIGDTTPDFNWDVAGTMNADGAVTFGSTLAVTGAITAGAATFSGTVALNGTNNTVNELTSSGTVALNGTNNTVGNADSDNLNSRATFAVSGTDPTVTSGSCTISGEAQSFRLTKTVGGAGACVVNLQRTFNSAPYCTTQRTSSKTADVYQSAETTSSVTFTFSDDIAINVWCPDRR